MDAKSACIFAFGGVHGTVTFALAFMVAETSVKKSDFNLVLMAEAVLIMLSLLVPTFIFQFILKRKPSDRDVVVSLYSEILMAEMVVLGNIDKRIERKS